MLEKTEGAIKNEQSRETGTLSKTGKIRYGSLFLLLSINNCMLIIPMHLFSTPQSAKFPIILVNAPSQIYLHTKVVVSFTHFSDIFPACQFRENKERSPDFFTINFFIVHVKFLHFQIWYNISFDIYIYQMM